MKTLQNNVISEIEIKNSRFITLLIKIDASSNINDIISNIKKEYPKATHYCYAYKLVDYSKSSDDGEPGGTAGIPMLNVLLHENIVNVLAVTVRYFGGIKLGAGGLVRAYTKSLTEALAKATLVDVTEGFVVEILVNYDEQKQLDFILKDIKYIEKDYKEKVLYKIKISKSDMSLIENYRYEIIDNTLVEKQKI